MVAGGAGACPAAPTLGARRAARVGQWPGWPLLRPWMAPWWFGESALATDGTSWRRFVRRRLVSAFGPPPRCRVATFDEGLAFSQLRSIARLAPGAQVRARLAHSAAGLCSSHARCSRTDLVSRTVLQDRARLPPGAAGRVDGGQVAGLLGLGAGGRPGVRKVGPFRSSLSLGCGGSRVRWCRGLGCWGGGPGGGSAVLLGGAYALALPGHHGRVGGMVAGVWHSVAVSVGRGENMFYLRTDRRRR